MKRWLCAAALSLAACGGDAEERRSREPVPAPRVELSAADRERWAAAPATRTGVPVLLYSDVEAGAFARQMALLDHAGYETIELDELVRLVGEQDVSLPPRPFVLTFDGGRLETWTQTDGVLRGLGFSAVLFVDVGRIEAQDPQYLTWAELNRLQDSGRWDVQLQSGTADHEIRYGPDPEDVGPFYAYRGTDEVLGGWRERTFSDITYGEEQLAHHVEGYRPLAFAPPGGNYGQAGTNDRRIPRLLLARLELSFDLVFTRDGPGFATSGAPNPLGRIQVTPAVADEQLRARVG
jgi:peptidoglycan/xylan/chitin deacetylase (PgdA/CDA1 family)